MTQAPAIGPKRPPRLPARRYAAVRVNERFRASPERVFDSWLNAEIAGRWLFATASRPMTSVTIDARAGGAFRFVDRNDGARIEHTGVYLEIIRPWRLAFTLSTDDGPLAMTRVVAEIVPLTGRKGAAGRGIGARARPPARTPGSPSGCELVLAHEDVPGQLADRIEARWSGMLYGLGLMLNRA